MYRWQPIIEAQPSVKAAFEAHFQAVEETVRWERKCKTLREELAFLTKAKTEMEEQSITPDKWPKKGTIWECVAEGKRYCQNKGVRWRERDKSVTWDVKERYISDVSGPEGAEYKVQLERELVQAEQQREKAKEAEDRALQALEAERESYQWLIECESGEEA